jgi:hypothetical protein
MGSAPSPGRRDVQVNGCRSVRYARDLAVCRAARRQLNVCWLLSTRLDSEIASHASSREGAEGPTSLDSALGIGGYPLRDEVHVLDVGMYDQRKVYGSSQMDWNNGPRRGYHSETGDTWAQPLKRKAPGLDRQGRTVDETRRQTQLSGKQPRGSKSVVRRRVRGAWAPRSSVMPCRNSRRDASANSTIGKGTIMEDQVPWCGDTRRARLTRGQERKIFWKK